MTDPFGGLPPPPPPRPERQKQPFLPATYGLLAALGLAFAVEVLAGRNPAGESSVALVRMGALWRGGVEDGDFWRVGSYAFLHIGWLHLLSNCWSMWMVMRQLELAFGSNLTLGFFSATAIAGGAASLGFAALRGRDAFAAGASGGAFGLFGAELALLFRIRHRFSTEMRQSIVRQLFFNLLINVGIAFSFRVDNAAHAGGLISGFLLGMLAPQRSLPARPWHTAVRWLTVGSVLVLGSFEGAAVGRAVKPKPRSLKGPGVEARIDPLFVQSEPGIADSPIGARIAIAKDPNPVHADPGDEAVRIGGRDWLRARSKAPSGDDRVVMETGDGSGMLVVAMVCADAACRGESGDKLLEVTAQTLRATP